MPRRAYQDLFQIWGAWTRSIGNEKHMRMRAYRDIFVKFDEHELQTSGLISDNILHMKVTILFFRESRGYTRYHGTTNLTSAIMVTTLWKRFWWTFWYINPIYVACTCFKEQRRIRLMEVVRKQKPSINKFISVINY